MATNSTNINQTTTQVVLEDVNQRVAIVQPDTGHVEAVVLPTAAPVIVINDVSNNLTVLEGGTPYGTADTTVIQQDSPNKLITVTSPSNSVVVVVGTGGGGLRYNPPIPISDVLYLQDYLNDLGRIQSEVVNLAQEAVSYTHLTLPTNREV